MTRFVPFVREATFAPDDDLDMLFVLADVRFPGPPCGPTRSR
jgi:hypothetical protein